MKRTVICPALMALLIVWCMASCFAGERGENFEASDQASGSRDAQATMPELTLRGDWMMMGMQYGRDAGPAIRENFDALYSRWSGKPYGDRYLKKCLSRFRSQIQFLSSQLFDFTGGIAMGAGEELARSPYRRKLTDEEKILFLNVAPEMLEYDAWHAGNLGLAMAGKESIFPFQGGTCWAARGPATFSHDVIIGFNRDMAAYPFKHLVALRVEPDEANRFMTTAPAGCIGSDFAVNSQQLFTGLTRVRTGSVRGGGELDFGVPAALMTTYIAAFCSSTEEAYQALRAGNEQYLKETGRYTLLGCTGVTHLLVDPERTVVVERTARHHYRRLVKDSLAIITNHFECGDSFNDEGMRTLIPMWKFGAGSSAPESRPGNLREHDLISRVKSGEKGLTLGEARAICSMSGSGTFGAHLIPLATLVMEYVHASPPERSGPWARMLLYH